MLVLAAAIISANAHCSLDIRETAWHERPNALLLALGFCPGQDWTVPFDQLTAPAIARVKAHQKPSTYG